MPGMMSLYPVQIFCNQKLLTEDQWEKVSGYALKFFARGRDMAAERRDLILVDTKYEFGFDDKKQYYSGR
jgi:phosphoribosylaminoimidazole-succinocarboxamide synthase